MKKTFVFKTFAFILCCITLVSAFFFTALTFAIADGGFYTRPLDTIRSDALDSFLYQKVDEYGRRYYHYTELFESNAERNNILYEIYDVESGKTVASNVGKKGEKSSVSVTETYTYVTYSDSENSFNTYKGESPYIYEINPEKRTISDRKTYRITLSIPEKYFTKDDISVTDDLIKTAYGAKVAIPATAAVSVLISLVLLIFLLASAGKRSFSGGEVCENFFDIIPYDLLIVIYCAIVAAAAVLFSELPTYRANGVLISFIIVLLASFALAALLILFLMTTSTRIKTKKLFTNTVVWYIIKGLFRLLRLIGRGFSEIFRNLGVYAKTILMLVCAMILGGILVAVANDAGGAGMFFMIIIWDVLAAYSLYRAYGLNRLMKDEEKLAHGDLSHEVDKRHLVGSLRRHAEYLGSIRAGMSAAVEERTRSEHFKTELITNVSHDLKTPLTSIVNYTALLKAEQEKEQPDETKMREYTEILERQSAKLRKLTEDLVEASKASTGNLKCEPVLLDVGELITQAAGEYAERFDEKKLEMIIREPDGTVNVMADGRHMWRIFDNLLGNIAKYALEGTRVYISLYAQESRATAIFRNTSKYELKLDSAELSERFVRGDASRHTDGSGLGLSIAKSLAELQGGTLDVVTDGDLFKVILTFPLAK